VRHDDPEKRHASRQPGQTLPSRRAGKLFVEAGKPHGLGALLADNYGGSKMYCVVTSEREPFGQLGGAFCKGVRNIHNEKSFPVIGEILNDGVVIPRSHCSFSALARKGGSGFDISDARR
jgi:hypothetical protein